MAYTKDRPTNMMGIPTSLEGSNTAIYYYVKPTVQNCKITFADGSTYWQKVAGVDKKQWFSTSEPDKLYIDEQCTIPAEVTRTQKIKECKKAGLI